MIFKFLLLSTECLINMTFKSDFGPLLAYYNQYFSIRFSEQKIVHEVDIFIETKKSGL